METTIDAILNRRLMVEQPKNGFRIAVDSILLAASIMARTGEKALDLGCGVGGAMLALGVRVNGLQINGLEIQPELADLARKNIERNRFEGQMQIYTGDVAFLPGPLLFCHDHVMVNPPYHEVENHTPSPDASKAIATMSPENALEIWITSAARCLKTSGIMTMIHRADRQDEILRLMKPYFGETEVIPLLPKEGELPKRVILHARKGEGAKLIKCRPLVLHRNSGGFTNDVEIMLRQCTPLVFAKERF